MPDVDRASALCTRCATHLGLHNTFFVASSNRRHIDKQMPRACTVARHVLLIACSLAVDLTANCDDVVRFQYGFPDPCCCTSSDR